MRQRFEDLEEWADADEWPAAEDWTGEEWVEPGLVQALRRVTHESLAEASDNAYEDALDAMLGGMSAAEGFNFSSALSQIARGAGQVVSNPIVTQVAGAALPIGAGALGTVIGGPAGTAIGSQLGTLAAGALTRSGTARPGTARPGTARPAPPANPLIVAAPGGSPAAALGGAPVPAAAGGSAAAAQALIATQLPGVVEHIAAAALGKAGARQIDGLPVADVMKMLSAMFGQAAADADELAYLDRGPEDGEGTSYTDPAPAWGRALYVHLMDAENEEFGR